MADALKQLVSLMEAKDKARVADLTAKEMARHCDKRVADAQTKIDRLRDVLVACEEYLSGKELNRAILLQIVREALAATE
jgi:hypothetical protein